MTWQGSRIISRRKRRNSMATYRFLSAFRCIIIASQLLRFQASAAMTIYAQLLTRSWRGTRSAFIHAALQLRDHVLLVAAPVGQPDHLGRADGPPGGDVEEVAHLVEQDEFAFHSADVLPHDHHPVGLAALGWPVLELRHVLEVEPFVHIAPPVHDPRLLVLPPVPCRPGPGGVARSPLQALPAALLQRLGSLHQRCVGASVPSMSMYATGPSNSRPRPRHSRGRTALTHSISSTTSASPKAPREVARSRRTRDRLRAQGVHVGRVVAQAAQVLEPHAPAQQVVGDVEHMVRLVVRQMPLQQLQPPVDLARQPSFDTRRRTAPMPPTPGPEKQMVWSTWGANHSTAPIAATGETVQSPPEGTVTGRWLPKDKSNLCGMRSSCSGRTAQPSSRIRITIPPIVSPSWKSSRGLSGWALWQLVQAGETATSAYTAVK